MPICISRWKTYPTQNFSRPFYPLIHSEKAKLIYINNIDVQVWSLIYRHIDVHLQSRETSKNFCSIAGGRVVMCNYYSNPQARVLSLWWALWKM